MRAMDAKQLNERLVDYLYGELDPQQLEAFEQGLRQHPEVQLELEAMQQTRSAFAELESFDPPAALTESLLQEASARAPGGAKPDLLSRLREAMRLLIVNPAVPAAAMLVLVLGVSLYVYNRGAPSEQIVPRGMVSEVAPMATTHKPSSPVEATNEFEAAAENEPVLAAPTLVPNEAEPKEERRQAANSGSSLALKEQGGIGKGAGRGGSSPTAPRRLARRETSKSIGYAKRSKRKRRRSSSDGARAIEAKVAKNADTAYGDRFDKLAAGGNAAAPQPAQRASEPARPAPAPVVAKRRQTAEGRQYAQPPPRKRSKIAARPVSSTAGPIELDDDWAAEQAPSAKGERSKTGTLGKRNAAMLWIERATEAAKRKQCAQALAYYEKAVRTSGQVIADVERRLGSCQALLQRNPARYPVLASRLRRLRDVRARRAATRQAQEAPAAAAPASKARK